MGKVDINIYTDYLVIYCSAAISSQPSLPWSILLVFEEKGKRGKNYKAHASI